MVRSSGPYGVTGDATGLSVAHGASRSSGRWAGVRDFRAEVGPTAAFAGPSWQSPGQMPSTWLATISGWAYSGENDLPEGIVEASLDQDEDWVVLTNREPLEGIETSGEWNSRCDFHAALIIHLSATACIDCV